MVQSETFRLLGYFFAIIKIVLSMLEAVKCIVNIGGIHDFTEMVKLILAFLYIIFSILMILGIRLLKERVILINRMFMMIMNILMIIYTTGEYLTMMIIRRQIEKGAIALIVIVIILIVVLIFELWLINGVLNYVRKKSTPKNANTVSSKPSSKNHEKKKKHKTDIVIDSGSINGTQTAASK